MRNYNVLYSDKTFRLEFDPTNAHSTTLQMRDDGVDHGTIQIVFHHTPEDGDRTRLALKSAVDSFNSAWNYYNREQTKVIRIDDETPAVELRIF